MKTRSRPGWIGRCGTDPDEPATHATYVPSGKRIRDGTMSQAQSARTWLPLAALAFCTGMAMAQERHATHDYQVQVFVNGHGTTQVTGQSGVCGANCYTVSPGNTLSVMAKGEAGAITRFSGACNGSRCQFTPTKDAVINVTFVPFEAIVALFDDSPPLPSDAIFSDGFEVNP